MTTFVLLHVIERLLDHFDATIAQYSYIIKVSEEIYQGNREFWTSFESLVNSALGTEDIWSWLIPLSNSEYEGTVETLETELGNLISGECSATGDALPTFDSFSPESVVSMPVPGLATNVSVTGGAPSCDMVTGGRT